MGALGDRVLYLQQEPRCPCRLPNQWFDRVMLAFAEDDRPQHGLQCESSQRRSGGHDLPRTLRMFRCSCPTGSAIWSVVPCSLTTSKAPMAGTTFWIPLLPVIGIGRCGLYEFLETEGYKYTIRLKVNAVLQAGIGHLLTRPVGRPPTMCAVSTPSSAIGPNRGTGLRVVAKDEWHPGELVPRVGFTVTNLARPAKRVVVSCIQRATTRMKAAGLWVGNGSGLAVFDETPAQRSSMSPFLAVARPHGVARVSASRQARSGGACSPR